MKTAEGDKRAHVGLLRLGWVEIKKNMYITQTLTQMIYTQFLCKRTENENRAQCDGSQLTLYKHNRFQYMERLAKLPMEPLKLRFMCTHSFTFNWNEVFLAFVKREERDLEYSWTRTWISVFNANFMRQLIVRQRSTASLLFCVIFSRALR